MKVLLTAKHWQIFGALILFPIITASIIYNSIPFEKNPSIRFFIIPISIEFLFLFFLTWEWSVIKSLKINRSNLSRFYITLISIFALWIFPLVITSFSIMGGKNGVNAFFVSTRSVWGILTWGMARIILLVYTSYICAKTIKRAKLKVGFPNIFWLFLLIALFPLGIWIIQPMINNVTNHFTFSSKE
ncbi:hypothetical protein [Marinilabilia rubra]|uniref:Uncharacterized protein n=1 Tax=Marinilabilia rubra TaxID=2162893 RepID=A0A2U2BBJ8_9BACT|nr:hypothetical protein [Marinilabilia rubra]PWE00439.1 hypothetical protein DDZ16_05785 [Marinilabilia rubra]